MGVPKKRGGGGAELRFQEIREGGEPGIQLFSVIYAIIIDIRLDEFPRGGARNSKAPTPKKCAPAVSLHLAAAQKWKSYPSDGQSVIYLGLWKVWILPQERLTIYCHSSVVRR